MVRRGEGWASGPRSDLPRTDTFTGFSGWSVGSPEFLSAPFYILPRGKMRLTWHLNCAWAEGSKEQCSCDGEWVGMPAKFCQLPPQQRRQDHLSQDLPSHGWGAEATGGSQEGTGDAGLGREAGRLLVRSLCESPGLGNYGHMGATRQLGFETLNYSVASAEMGFRTSGGAPGMVGNPGEEKEFPDPREAQESSERSVSPRLTELGGDLKVLAGASVLLSAYLFVHGVQALSASVQLCSSHLPMLIKSKIAMRGPTSAQRHSLPFFPKLKWMKGYDVKHVCFSYTVSLVLHPGFLAALVRETGKPSVPGAPEGTVQMKRGGGGLKTQGET